MKEYTIKKGNYYPGINFSPIWKPAEIKFEFSFTESCLFECDTDTQIGGQWNKLGGISFDILGLNSARLAWRPNWKDKLIEVVPYYHNKGVFSFNENSIIRFKIGDIGVCEIKTRNYELFGRKSMESVIQFGHQHSYKLGSFYHDFIRFRPSLIGRKQYPYFGGKASSPHDIKILTNI